MQVRAEWGRGYDKPGGAVEGSEGGTREAIADGGNLRDDVNGVTGESSSARGSAGESGRQVSAVSGEAGQ